jgi:multisubunit Na+/H+ antiporter MnhC subunit
MIVSTVRRNEPRFEENAPMSRSSEFLNLALLTAIVIGLATLSRFF